MAQIGYEAMNSEYRAIAYQRKSVVQMKELREGYCEIVKVHWRI